MPSTQAGQVPWDWETTRDGRGEDIGGHNLLPQTGSGCPTGRVVRRRVFRQPGGVGGETARWKMIQPRAVPPVSNGVLDLGMAASGFHLQGSIVPITDGAMMAVRGEEGQLAAGHGRRSPGDGTDRCGTWLTLEEGAGGLPIWAAPSIL